VEEVAGGATGIENEINVRRLCEPSLKLELTSEPSQIAPVRKAIEDFAQRSGFNDDSVAQVGLVVNEALANVIRHAYQGATGRPIVVTAEYSEPTLAITMRDWGSGVCPSGVKSKAGAELLKPGGLGLVCMRKLMDQVEFHPQADGMLLEMKRIKGEEKHG
jgi:serine/threonine-protein kinase RsbW